MSGPRSPRARHAQQIRDRDNEIFELKSALTRTLTEKSSLATRVEQLSTLVSLLEIAPRDAIATILAHVPVDVLIDRDILDDARKVHAWLRATKVSSAAVAAGNRSTSRSADAD